jgi:hypothetical protein
VRPCAPRMSASGRASSAWTRAAGTANDDRVKEIYPGDGDPRAVPGVQPGAGHEPDPALAALADRGELWMRRRADDTTWQIGGSGQVDWIAENFQPGRTIATAIPPVFCAYATVVVPGHPHDKQISDAALLSVLRAESSQQPWWLGYLETGVADVVFPDAPRVSLYAGWPYVLVRAGPDEAASWRKNDKATPWHSALPELMFPLDRSWLVSTLWDDDWRCLGGAPNLIQALLQHPRLEARAVTLPEDATPPGHHDG